MQLGSVEATVTRALRVSEAAADSIVTTAHSSQLQPRVLIMSADLGSGHDVLANTLRAELLARYPRAAVEVANSLGIANPPAYELMKQTMVGQVTNAPGINQAVYSITSEGPALTAMRAGLDAAYGPGVERQLTEFSPDIVVSTFPMTTSVLATLRREGKTGAQLIVPALDADPHRIGLPKGVDQHVLLHAGDAARFEARAESSSWKVPQHTIARAPLNPEVFMRHATDQTRREFGLPINQPLILVTGGSNGWVMPQQSVERLAREGAVTVAVATGKNEQLAASIHQSSVEGMYSIPFTDRMPALIQAADGVIVNSGGMTSLESLASGTPVIFHHPQSGHGIDSARALESDGVASFARTADDLIPLARSMNAQYSGRESLGDIAVSSEIRRRADSALDTYASDRSLTDVISDFIEGAR